MNAKFFETLYARSHLFRRITTFSHDEFNLLARKLEPEWVRKEFERLNQRKRKNAVGQGRKYALKTFPNLLLAVILYLRTTIGYELLGLLLGVDPGTVKRAVARVSPLLKDRFIPNTPLNKKKQRTNDLDDFLKDYPELTDVIFDGTELSINRPKKRQRYAYSGKKKRHTKKSVVARDKRTRLFLGVSPPKNGKIHDKKQMEQTGWDKLLPKKVNRWGDLGYFGMKNWKLPYKKPKGKKLPKKKKRQNVAHSRERIGVEHGIRMVKTFRRIGELVKIKSNDYLYTLLLASTNLANFKMLARQGIG
jgi:hypothetical protein